MKLQFKIVFVLIYLLILPCFISVSIAEVQGPLPLSEKMKRMVTSNSAFLMKKVNNPIIINAVKAQNNKNMSLEAIKTIDREWIAGKQTKLVKSLQENAVGKYLRDLVEKSSAYVEAFVCDKNGAIVGLFPKTTDYWQGDEDKFIESYGNGKGRIYYGPLSFDESTQTYSVQISIPINDWNDTIGVLIVGIMDIHQLELEMKSR